MFDAIIIYLALGAPVAANRFLAGSGKRESRIGRAFLAWCFWIFLMPAFSHRYITNLLKRKEQTANFGISAELSTRLFRAVDSASRTSSGYPGMFQLRDSLERYLGVAALLEDSRETDVSGTEALFEIASHPAPYTASACFHRHNRSVIARHHKDAADELVRICGRLAEGSDQPLNVIDAFENLFEVTGDVRAAGALSGLQTRFTASDRASQLKDRERPKWETSTMLPQPKGTTVGVRDLTLMSSLPGED